MAKDFFFPQIDNRTFSSSDFRFHFDIDNGIANAGNDAHRSRVVFHMNWYDDAIVFDVWNGTHWESQKQIYYQTMQRGIVRTSIVVHDNIMKVSDF